MRFQPILLMALPPSDDDLTVPGASYRPEYNLPDISDGTQPLTSPYLGDAGAPPPPPPTGPAPLWRPAPPPLPRASAPGRQGGLIAVAAVLVAVALLAFAGVAFALSQASGNTSHPTVAHGATATPRPGASATSAPTVAPTTAPTAIPTSSSQNLPPAPPGFTGYTSSDGIWGLNYPQGADIQTSMTPTQRGNVPTTAFALDYGATFTVFDLPHSANKTQQVISMVATALHADNLQIFDTGNLPTPNITWQIVRVSGTVDDQPIQATLLYTIHNGGATVISMSATPDQYATANDMLFQPMILSFTYLT